MIPDNMIMPLNVNGYPVFMIVWNLFLALIPVTLAWGAAAWIGKKDWRKLGVGVRVGFVALFLAWLFFLPNTAYLFSIVRHLLDHCDDYDPYLRVCREEAWMVPVFFLYALAGVPTFVYALRKMAVLLGRLFHSRVTAIFSIVMMPVTALGLLIGLVERFNSWDIVNRPALVLETALSYFSDPWKLLALIVYTAVLSTIYFGTLLLIKWKP